MRFHCTEHAQTHEQVRILCSSFVSSKHSYPLVSIMQYDAAKFFLPFDLQKVGQTIRSISLAYVRALSMSSLDGIDGADFSSTCRKVILPSFTSHSLCITYIEYEHKR